MPELDLEACAREPIHIPGTIQPHGHLLALASPRLTISYVSAAAAEVLSVLPAAALGLPLWDVLQVEPAEPLRVGLPLLPEHGPVQLGECRSLHGGAVFQVIGHRSPEHLVVLEFEAAPEPERPFRSSLQGLYPTLRGAFDRLREAPTVEEMTQIAASETRALTGFDRVMVYRFEDNWDGVVVAEDRSERLPSYLDLRFPASDIPAQARRLYEVNRLRLIADVDYAPVPVLAAPGNPRPLDLSFSILRSVSPVHLQYMRNMGTPASMSVSLLRGGRLWGLMSCHHAEPRHVPFGVRAACDLLGQMLASGIAAKEEAGHAESRAQLKSIAGRLLAQMAASQGRIVEGLANAPYDLCALAGASGAAVITEAGCVLLGRTPPEPRVREIASWLYERGGDELFETAALPALLGDDRLAPVASGLLAASISRLHPSFVLWFRPELVRTVHWGGDPHKPAEPSGSGAAPLSPRRSFEIWKETVRGTSAPWSPAQTEAARDLRSAIVRVVLRQAEERAQLTGQLERINAELAAFSYSISHDLRAPFRHIAGYAELLLEREGERLDDKSRRYVATIIESARTAGQLVDSLLEFSRMGRTSLTPVSVDPRLLVEEVRDRLALEARGRNVEWRIGAVPQVRADPVLLRQVFQNLLSNALKYTRPRERAVIEVTGCVAGTEVLFTIRDNGVGFENAYAHKLFGVFQRLHRVEDYDGVGIGLANVRRIVERHGGRVWAEGALDRGATFCFTLPLSGPNPEKA